MGPGVCPLRNWLVQVHQGWSNGHPGLIRSRRRLQPDDTICRGVSGLDVFSRARRPPHHLDVRTGVFAGLTTYANWPYVHCL